MFKDYKYYKNKLLTFDLDFECQSFFEENEYYLELAYCKLLNDELGESLNIFESLKETTSRARWGCVMLGILLDRMTPYPTYLDLKNFLEIDINILLNYEKGKYVDEIVNYADVFASVNPETFKYLGRAFFNNEIYSYAKFFLERAKNYLYRDPELHYLLAQFYLKEGNEKRALSTIENCLNILPEYFPALKLKEKLTKV